MINFPSVNWKCNKCGGSKYIGEQYYSNEELWVDVTCIQCSHSVDIEVSKLEKFIEQTKKRK
jgi:hypothetical protein